MFTIFKNISTDSIVSRYELPIKTKKTKKTQVYGENERKQYVSLQILVYITKNEMFLSVPVLGTQSLT